MAGYKQISKLTHFRNTVKANGGFKNTLYKLWRFDTFKHGTLMGWDSNGNKYYENQRYMIGRSRWVEYADYYKWDYDASQVTPEWFGWLHYLTDQVPCCNQVKCCMRQSECHDRWLLPPAENLSGTKRAYYPYSTTRANVFVWDVLTKKSIYRSTLKKNRSQITQTTGDLIANKRSLPDKLWLEERKGMLKRLEQMKQKNG